MAAERRGGRARPARAPVAVIVVSLAALLACGSGGDDGGAAMPAPLPQENPQYRALAGISMGAYGALNLGTKHADVFGTLGALGGPVDLNQLLVDIHADGLEVKPQTVIPRAVGEDFTFDQQPPYPGRDTQQRLLRDLVIAFGNPFLHHPDPARPYFAIDSEPAVIRRDDVFGELVVGEDVRGFLDGGDANEDGLRQTGEAPTLPADVVLLAPGSLQAVFGVEPSTIAGGRALADLDGDGVYDLGDGIVLNPSEPLVEQNGNLLYEPELGEQFEDTGLDGVPGTGNFGEGNGAFDLDPDRATWLEEDPTRRIATLPASEIARQRIYMDVGTEDEFGFARHYTNLTEILRGKGLSVEVQEGFAGDRFDLPKPEAPLYLLRYPGGHVGIPDSDSIVEDLLDGDVCGAVGIYQRLVSFLGYLDASFPDGNYGVGEIDIDIDDFDFDFDDLDVRGEMVARDVPAPTLQLRPEDPVPTQRVLGYLPPEFERSDGSFPIVYFLGGYGQSPEDYEPAAELFDVLIVTRRLQNMFFAFLPGAGGQKGSFYVNHRIPETAVPEAIGPTSGRYGDVILADLIPYVENEIARGRIRR